jgi:CheY-like chemotaxis protein
VLSSAVEHFLHTEGATGSIPVAPTIIRDLRNSQAVACDHGPYVSRGIEVIGAETWEQAVERLRDADPDLVIVCYVFDEMRPFRLLHYLRHEKRGHVATILVRAVPVSLGTTQEAEIRESYRILGVPTLA